MEHGSHINWTCIDLTITTAQWGGYECATIPQLRKERHRAVKSLTQGHTASLWKTPDLVPSSWDPILAFVPWHQATYCMVAKTACLESRQKLLPRGDLGYTIKEAKVSPHLPVKAGPGCWDTTLGVDTHLLSSIPMTNVLTALFWNFTWVSSSLGLPWILHLSAANPLTSSQPQPPMAVRVICQ
jgi:hypothetical protein